MNNPLDPVAAFIDETMRKLVQLPLDVVMPAVVILEHLDPRFTATTHVQDWVAQLQPAEAQMLAMLQSVAADDFQPRAVNDDGNG